MVFFITYLQYVYYSALKHNNLVLAERYLKTINMKNAKFDLCELFSDMKIKYQAIISYYFLIVYVCVCVSA